MTSITPPAGRRIRTADHVHHKPSGEEWVVGFADYETGYLAPLGWPDCDAKISDCDLIKAADDEEYTDTLARISVSGDRRGRRAMEIHEVARAAA